MKYGIFDESGTAMLTSDESAKKLPEEFDGDTYALCVRFSFDVDGDISDIQVGGTAYDKTSSLRQSNGCMTTAFIQRRRLIFRLRRR